MLKISDLHVNREGIVLSVKEKPKMLRYVHLFLHVKLDVAQSPSMSLLDVLLGAIRFFKIRTQVLSKIICVSNYT